VLGVVIGGTIGNQIGRNLSCDDRRYAYQSYYDGLQGEPGQHYVWRNDADGDHGYIIPGETYRDHDGYECRDFQQVMVVHGDRQDSSGTVCRQDDGTWAVVR
jgi:surface antigen